MDILEFKDLEDWRLKNECYPFEDSLGNLCITVESEYESFGGEKDARLLEARDYGIDRLIRFYGKLTPPTELYDAASTPDYFISSRVCARMKVLVKIPKSTFDENTADDTTCDINKPPEGYLSAFISVENYERDIDYITTSMEDFLPKMAKADKYMTNINIVKEIKRLKQVKNVIRRYFNLNSVTATAIEDEECELNVDPHLPEAQMEIGFSYDYNPAFVLIDGNKHTIGYDCFLEASLLSHPTTANYLIQLGNMSSALTSQLSLDFDIFQFLSQHTYPTPVIEIKENSLDGIEKYDANGNLFSFANLAKLITLELDKKSCKTDEDKQREDDVVFSDATKSNIAETVRQSKEFVGNWYTSSEGEEDLKQTLRSMKKAKSSPDLIWDKVYNDVVSRIDFNCVLEESLKCALEAAITRLGEAAFDDPDLSEFFNADGVVEVFGFGGCGPEDDCEKELQLKVGLPVFKGIKIPDNFPTTDYVAKAIDAALKQLYSALINAIVSFIEKIFELMCKMISELPDTAAIKSMFGDGFKSWLSDTIGVDVSKLSDGKAWADAALSAGGTGFMGAVGNLTSKAVGSWDALISETGISLNLPNPNTGLVEQVLVSTELIYQTMSGVQKATEDLEVVLTSGELKSLYKGTAPDDVMELAFGCLNRGNPDLFQSREDVSDLFSSLGEMVSTNFLEESATTPITVTNACGLGDGTNQDILAKNYLTSKDPLLSDSEIEELLSQEKNRLIEKIKQIHKLLKSFQDGTLFPSFPSLFGSEDSLIPEAPPVISAAMATVSEGLYSSTINNFNVSMTQYAPLWTDLITLATGSEPEGEGPPSFVNLTRKLMISDNRSALIYMNLVVDDSSTNVVTNLGYILHNDIEDRDGIKINAEPAKVDSIGTYDWTEGDILNNFDAGNYTNKEYLNYWGEDDERFAKMLTDAGVWVPEFSWVNEFKEWFFDSVSEIEIDERLIVEIAFAVIVLLAAGVAGFFTAGMSWYAAAGIIIGLIAAAGVLTAAVHYGVNTIIGLLPINEEFSGTITQDDVECLYKSGKITDAEWEDIEPNLEEVVEMTNKALIMDQWFKMSVIADYLEADATAENGTHIKSFDITNMLDSNSKYFSERAGNKIELVLETETSGLGNLKKNEIYTKTSVAVTPHTTEDVILSRPSGFSEVITSFERRGIRKTNPVVNTQQGETNFGAINASLTKIQELNSLGIELIEYDNIETKIANYFMENESSLLLGRKIVKSDLLETKYSSTKEVPDKAIMEVFEESYDEDDEMQEYHKRLEQITGQAGLYALGPKNAYKDIWEGCVKKMTKRVHDNRMYLDEYINALEFEYPKQDILGYNKVRDESIDLTNSIMKLQSSNSDYCDALTPLRRSGSISGLRLSIRIFIIERVLNSIQIFDTFNTGFMTSDMFIKAVFNDIKTEMEKYYYSFATTLKGKILSDMKETAVKYFEIQKLLGNEIPEINSDKEAMIEIIKMEVEDINTTIASQLKLDTQFNSSSWDDFVFDYLLQEEVVYASGKRDYVVDKLDDDGYKIFDNETGDWAKEEHYGAVEETYKSVLKPFFVRAYAEPSDGDEYNHYAELVYQKDAGADEYIIVSAQCLGPAPTVSSDPCEPSTTDFSNVRQMLFNNEIYQDLISYVFPLKDAATLLSTYHLSAITDPAVFNATEDGKHVTDLFAEAKLSTLQTFLASIHGAGETTYIDPFLEKLKT